MVELTKSIIILSRSVQTTVIQILPLTKINWLKCRALDNIRQISFRLTGPRELHLTEVWFWHLILIFFPLVRPCQCLDYNTHMCSHIALSSIGFFKVAVTSVPQQDTNTPTEVEPRLQTLICTLPSYTLDYFPGQRKISCRYWEPSAMLPAGLTVIKLKDSLSKLRCSNCMIYQEEQKEVYM